jgi:hypothetical protein
MPMDEVEFVRALGRLRVKFDELGNPALEEVLHGLIDLIEATYDRITEIEDNSDIDNDGE